MTSPRKRRPSPRPSPRLAIVAPPPARGRHDGWTAARQVGFLQALAVQHDVSLAARAVGMSRQSAYKLRARLKGQPFDMAWDAAFQSAFDALAEAAMARALHGVEVPHYHKGELVGTSRRFDERLTIALLGMRAGLLRPPAPPYHEAAGYDAEDFRALLHRVATGDECWDGDDADEAVAWDGDGIGGGDGGDDGDA